MKKATFLCCAFMGIAITSCETIDSDALASNSTTSQTETVKTRQVQFVCKGLDVDYTRATLASESITDLYVWEGATLLAHQVSTDADFGSPTIALAIGAHDLTFVASKSEGQSWADGTWSCSKVKDTYGTVLSYTVSSNSSSKQVQLTRCNGKVRWTIEDALPSTARTCTISLPQCYGLDASLDGTGSQTFTYTYDVTSYAGSKNVSVSTLVFPANHADGSTFSPTITISDGTSTLCTYTTECEIKANTVTQIHGSFFSGSNNAQVSLSTEWSSDTTYVSIR